MELSSKRNLTSYIALILLLAPIGNLLGTYFIFAKVVGFSLPLFKSYLESIESAEWTWLCLIFLAGLFLIRPRKVSWTLSIVALSIVSALSFIRLISFIVTHGFQHQFVFHVISLGLSGLFLFIVYRFSFFDRRGGWGLQVVKRKKVDLLSSIEFDGKIFPVRVESLSENGVRFVFTELSFPELNEGIEVNLNLSSLKESLSSLKVRLIGPGSRIVRGVFHGLSKENRKYLKDS